MALYLKLTDVNDNEVYVNPMNVTFVRHAQADQTQIFFASDHAIRVKGAAADVVAKLESVGLPTS